MTNVSVSYGNQNPTHDISLSDGSVTYGLIYSGGPRVLQEVPLSPPAQQFEIEHRNWIGGRGRNRYDDDPTGFFDDYFLWSTTEEKLMPALQWRWGGNVRSCDSNWPGDNSTLSWWKLYGNSPASDIARYLSVTFTASATYNADKAQLIIKKVGSPGNLTLELCANNGGSPGTVHKTVVNTTGVLVSSPVTFDWTGTHGLTSAGVYHLKVYGAATDSADNHWEVLTNASGSSSKYSTDDSTWTAAGVTLYYRITDADTARQWRYWFHEGCLHKVSQADAGGTPVLMRNGEIGVATAGSSTTLTCSALSMTTNEYAGAYIKIYDGTGDGQVRQIVSNTSTQFTVSGWAVTPDTSSKFIVYATDKWTVIGSHGLTVISGRPICVGNISYFPQGGTAMRRMRLNGNTYEFADDGTNTATLLGTSVEGATLKVFAAFPGASSVKVSDAKAWGTNLVFGTAKVIGTSDYRITNLFSHNRTLYVMKEDGPYTYTNGTVEKLGSNFADVPDRYTGIGIGAQNQYLWFGWAHSIVRMLGNSVDDMMNYKRGYDGMPENRTGWVSSIVSAVGWLFFVIDGGTSNPSSIIVWNGYGWHEIYRTWAGGVRIRNAIWQPCPETRGRLWFDVNGDAAYIEFPQYAANPLQDSNNSPKGHGVNYHWEGVCVSPTYDAHDPSLYKVLQNLRVFTEYGSVEVDYQTNANVGTTTWTVLDTANSQPMEDLTLELGQIFQVRFRFRLQVANTRTPAILTGWQLTGRFIPPTKYQYLGRYKIQSDGETKTSETDHNGNSLYTQLKTWAERQTKLTLRTMFESSDNKAVTIGLPSKSVDSIDDDNGLWNGDITISILEV